MNALIRSLVALGGDPRQRVRALRGIVPYLANLREVQRRRQEAPPTLRLRLRGLHPRLTDRYEAAGVASGHYFHQDVWVARRIHTAAPASHYDIGSRIDGFVAHLLAFREVHVLDIRQLTSSHPGLHFHQANMLDLPFGDASLESLSSLHAVEHVGLGRYGDPIAPAGCFDAMRELQRVVAPRGTLYFSVPIGRERLEFDAHRVFAPATVLDAFPELTLVEFGAVDDRGDLVEGAEPKDLAGAEYSCGIFVLRRPAEPGQADAVDPEPLPLAIDLSTANERSTRARS